MNYNDLLEELAQTEYCTPPTQVCISLKKYSIDLCAVEMDLYSPSLPYIPVTLFITAVCELNYHFKVGLSVGRCLVC